MEMKKPDETKVHGKFPPRNVCEKHDVDLGNDYMRHELLSNLVQSPHLTAFNLSVSKSMFQFLSVLKEGE